MRFLNHTSPIRRGWHRRSGKGFFALDVGKLKVFNFPKYRLRFFFDVWAGDCLWSDNDAALERFGYPVTLDDLELSGDTLRSGTMLIERLQANVMRESLGYGTVPDEQFDSDASAFLAALRQELGADFEVVDER